MVVCRGGRGRLGRWIQVLEVQVVGALPPRPLFPTPRVWLVKMKKSLVWLSVEIWVEKFFSPCFALYLFLTLFSISLFTVALWAFTFFLRGRFPTHLHLLLLKSFLSALISFEILTPIDLDNTSHSIFSL